MSSNITFEIIATGSQGNAVVLEKQILIDCGVSLKALSAYVGNLKLVLLTHIHADHFNQTTIRALAASRPMLRFGCMNWLVSDLFKCGVPAGNVDVLVERTAYGYGLCNVIPVRLKHDVPNCGYKVHFPHGKVFYATDTNNLNGISARNYDLYLIEANYEDEDIQRRIAEKELAGEYAYERKVLKNHLSKAKCDDFIYKNIGRNSVYYYLHTHIGREGSGADA